MPAASEAGPSRPRRARPSINVPVYTLTSDEDDEEDFLPQRNRDGGSPLSSLASGSPKGKGRAPARASTASAKPQRKRKRIDSDSDDYYAGGNSAEEEDEDEGSDFEEDGNASEEAEEEDVSEDEFAGFSEPDEAVIKATEEAEEEFRLYGINGQEGLEGELTVHLCLINCISQRIAETQAD